MSNDISAEAMRTMAMRMRSSGRFDVADALNQCADLRAELAVQRDLATHWQIEAEREQKAQPVAVTSGDTHAAIVEELEDYKNASLQSADDLINKDRQIAELRKHLVNAGRGADEMRHAELENALSRHINRICDLAEQRDAMVAKLLELFGRGVMRADGRFYFDAADAEAMRAQLKAIPSTEPAEPVNAVQDVPGVFTRLLDMSRRVPSWTGTKLPDGCCSDVDFNQAIQDVDDWIAAAIGDKT